MRAAYSPALGDIASFKYHAIYFRRRAQKMSFQASALKMRLFRRRYISKPRGTSLPDSPGDIIPTLDFHDAMLMLMLSMLLMLDGHAISRPFTTPELFARRRQDGFARSEIDYTSIFVIPYSTRQAWPQLTERADFTPRLRF